MKRILLLFLITTCGAMSIAAQKISFSACINGYWGDWHSRSIKTESSRNAIRFWNSLEEPYNYCFEFTIDKSLPNEGTWEVYEGVVTYFINDDYPTIKAALQKNYNTPKVTPKETGRPFLKKTAKAKIKRLTEQRQGEYVSGYNIWGNPKYKKYTYTVITYNVWFEDIGIGISLDYSNK